MGSFNDRRCYYVTSLLIGRAHTQNNSWIGGGNDLVSIKPLSQPLKIFCHLDGEEFIDMLSPRQNGRHFADNIFKCIFLNENVWIAIDISLKFVHWSVKLKIFHIGSDNGLVPIRPEAIIWTTDDYFSDAYMHHSASMSLDQIEYCFYGNAFQNVSM